MLFIANLYKPIAVIGLTNPKAAYSGEIFLGSYAMQALDLAIAYSAQLPPILATGVNATNLFNNL